MLRLGLEKSGLADGWPGRKGNLFGGDEDGRITPWDRIWPHLWLWIDRDHDGVSDRSELRLLAASRVRVLHLGFLKA